MVEVIYDSKVYANKMVDKLSNLYYLIFSKEYNISKNTWKIALVVIYLIKMIRYFY